MAEIFGTVVVGVVIAAVIAGCIWCMWQFAKATDGWGALGLMLALSSCSA